MIGLGQGCIRREGTSEAAPEAVRQAVGGGCQSGWGRLLSVTNAIEAGSCRPGAVAGHRLGALEGLPPTLRMHPWAPIWTPRTSATPAALVPTNAPRWWPARSGGCRRAGTSSPSSPPPRGSTPSWCGTKGRWWRSPTPRWSRSRCRSCTTTTPPWTARGCWRPTRTPPAS